MSDRAFLAQLDGYRLTMAEIRYHRPDAPSLLQLFVWQDYDLAPDFPCCSLSLITGTGKSKPRCIPSALPTTI